MEIITINGLTKDYGNHKGVFNVSIAIKKGEVYGYLGPNGAGKSTTMRHLMGFGKPDRGEIYINGLNAWTQQEKIKETIGYLPGEIALPTDMTGREYLLLIAKMRKMKSLDRMEELLSYFEITGETKIKSMSKGMKQKIAIVSTFMHEPTVYLLDEPTSGLDPLMQEKFINLMLAEKKKGKTILLSSHIFEEVAKVCDRIGTLKNGELVNEIAIEEIKHNNNKTYKIEFQSKEDFDGFMEETKFNENIVTRAEQLQILVDIDDGKINDLIRELAKRKLAFMSEQKHSLEEHFMQYYGGTK